MRELEPAQPGTADPLAELLELADAYVLRSKAPATLKAYATDWRHFSDWCSARGLAALPADVKTVAAYLAAHGGRLAVTTLRRRLSSISQIHQAAGHRTPTATAEVRLVWQGIVRTHGRRPARQAEPAVTDTLRAMVATLDGGLLGRRDRALLLIGFAGFLRRSELVALDVADVVEVPEGLEVLLHRSKTDQEGEGAVLPIPYGAHEATCPVRAWRAWVTAAGIAEGPAFRGVDRHGNVATTRLSDKTVARAVKRAAERAGLDTAAFSGHSLRAGLAVAAARAGVAEELIMEQGRWKSPAVARSYVRKGQLWRDVAAAQVGL
ncbi:MAG TPA: tyrosine-type recombinase/integrase [Actinomycetota bacterium]|nr:tyrosine-type recombinase/integrase [Actinomycetota bacterium]